MNLQELNIASFRGVQFYVKSATTSGGRKQLKHEYPNSPKQKIQDLGFMPRNFKLQAVIAATYDSNGNETSSYRANRDALLAALEEEGNGTLSHPFFDASIEVTARPFTLDESMSNIGRADISLEFDYSALKSVPKPTATSKAQIYQAKENANAAASDSFIEKLATSTVDGYNSALGAVNGFTDSVLSTVQSWQVSIGFDTFSQSVADIVSTASEIIRQPQQLADSITGVMSTISSLYSLQGSSINVLKQLFSFGDDFVYKNETTYQRAQYNDSQQAMSEIVQTQALNEAYNSAAQIDYTTINEIESVQATLEAQYQVVMGFADQATLDAVSTLRQLTNSYLEVAKLNEGRFIDVTVPTLPASVIAFMYYGNDTELYAKASTIVDINGPESYDTCFITGDIQVITQ